MEYWWPALLLLKAVGRKVSAGESVLRLPLSSWPFPENLGLSPAGAGVPPGSVQVCLTGRPRARTRRGTLPPPVSEHQQASRDGDAHHGLENWGPPQAQSSFPRRVRARTLEQTLKLGVGVWRSSGSRSGKTQSWLTTRAPGLERRAGQSWTGSVLGESQVHSSASRRHPG